MNHIPIKPTEEQLAWISKLEVDCNFGKVFRDGKELGHFDKSVGYVKIVGPGRIFRRHHIVWYHYHKVWPEQLVDYRDRSSTNDSIGNLRYLDSRDNALNSKRSDRDLPPGVYKATAAGSYEARIWLGVRGNYRLGTFHSVEEAYEAVETAHEQLDTAGPDSFPEKEKVVKTLPEGVRLHKANKKNPYKSKIWTKDGEKHLGYFPTPEAASAAFQKAKAERDANSSSH